MGVESQCFLSVFGPSPQNCLIALTSVLGGPHALRGPPSQDRTVPANAVCEFSRRGAESASHDFGLESEPSRESDDKNDFGAIHS